MRQNARMRSVLVIAFEDVQILDVAGPLEVFNIASRLLERDARGASGYRLELAAPQRGPVRTSNGLQLIAASTVSHISVAPDTLLVAGGPGARAAARDPHLLGCLTRLALDARRVGSVCTGALVLAAAGLLDGRRATTHWQACSELSRDHPEVRVLPNSIFVQDGKFWTSAGVTAGMDLALALVEQDVGRKLALRTAQHLVMYLKRPGGQAQFSSTLAAQHTLGPTLDDLVVWISDHLADDLRVERLARVCGMSPRNFARRFVAELGVSPARFVEQLRIEAARRRLEESRDGLDQIAQDCGFGSGEVMRRTFHRRLSVSPRDYRQRFQSREDLPA